MKELIFGISGVRGIVGETLTSEVVMKIGMAFGNYMKLKVKSEKLKVIVGRDARKSGEMLKEAFVKGLKVKSEKLKVVDMGVITTPGLLFNIKELDASGGVVITASHNPSEWNGIKFANADGIFLDAKEMEKVYEIYNGLQITDYRLQDYKIAKDDNGQERHIAGVMRVIDVESIRSQHLKVVIDSFIDEGENFLKELGCQVICESSERELEPVAENLVDLSRRVKEVGADIGFATDPDGDRLSIVTEKGEALGEEYTLPLVASRVLKKEHKAQGTRHKLVIVTNLSTSRMLDDVVAQNSGRVIRTKVGEINVVKEMLRSQAVFGGEGNGGIIDPQVQYTRDALVGMGRILDYMTSSGERISVLANHLPKYHMVKEKIKITDYRLQITDFDFLIKLFPEGEINKEDGMRIDFKEGWIHLRKSNTEPILRIVCETKNKDLTNSIVGTIMNKMC
ncbi:phosphoglucosamine mutase [candidate division WOR-3 bacterium]|nr:phosphoglucosamine mutase [candidate division WOR-3 bacterium]